MMLRAFLNIVATGLGTIMVLSPLALWTVYSEKIFYGIPLILELSFCIFSLMDNEVAARYRS